MIIVCDVVVANIIVQNCAVPSSMKGVQVVNAIRHFALQRGILKNISAFANLKHIRVCCTLILHSFPIHLHSVQAKRLSFFVGGVES